MAVDSLARAMAAGKTPVDAYQMAVAGGYTGTKEEFEEEMGNSAANASNAAASAAEAAASAVTAANVNANMAPVYDSSSETGYAVGDYVLYGNALYRCKNPVAPASAWDSSKWEAVAVSGQLDDLGGKLTGLRSEKADAIHATAEGAIASFPDGADGEPMDSVVIDIDPVQDLHGYESPWPAGGGGNKLNPLTATAGYKFSATNGTPVVDDNFTVSDYIPVVGGESYYFINVERSYNGSAGWWYDSSKNDIARFSISGGTDHATSGASTAPENAAYVRINWLTANTNIAVNYPSTVTTYSPYSNICPITGHTAARVTRCGKNLLNPKVYDGGAYNPPEGSTWNLTESATQFTPNADRSAFSLTTSTTWRYYTIIYPVIKGVSQHRSLVFTSNATGGLTEGYLDGSFTVLTKSNSTDSTQTKDGTLAIPDGAAYYYIVLTNRSTAVATLTITNPMIELGTSKTEYAPYAGQTYDISWQSEAGTVYGGTLNVTTGVLTVTNVCETKKWSDGLGDVDLGSFIRRGFSLSNACLDNQPTDKSNIAPRQATYNGDSLHFYINGTNTRAYVFLPEGTDGNTEIQLLYSLATPITYQLTPTEVETLLGENNVWADTGDTAVGYVADTKLYIEQLTKPGDEDMTANANIASGKFFLVGNSLFYSTTAIAAGATIIPGINCTAVSLADALNQLNT